MQLFLTFLISIFAVNAIAESAENLLERNQFCMKKDKFYVPADKDADKNGCVNVPNKETVSSSTSATPALECVIVRGDLYAGTGCPLDYKVIACGGGNGYPSDNGDKCIGVATVATCCRNVKFKSPRKLYEEMKNNGL